MDGIKQGTKRALYQYMSYLECYQKGLLAGWMRNYKEMKSACMYWLRSYLNGLKLLLNQK